MTTVALFQGPEISGSVADNLAAITSAAAAAAALGAGILITPEMSTTGYNIGGLLAGRAEPSDGSIYHCLSSVAHEHSIAIVYGYPESDDGNIYNSVQVVDRDGTSLANYRKTHLYGELDRSLFVPGQEWIVAFDFDGIRCGLLTCYDVEFPENVRGHADAGTEWLIVPTGLMEPFNHVTLSMVAVRAFESQVFISYVNRCGVEHGLTYCGSSCVIAPDGTELVRAGAGEELLTTAIDPEWVARSREENPYLKDRRRDLY